MHEIKKLFSILLCIKKIIGLSQKNALFLSCQLVHLPSAEQSLYPGRPRGGLTIVPSRHFSQQCRPRPTLWAEDFAGATVAISCSTNTSYLHLSHSLEKHIVMCPVLGCPFSRTLPVTPFQSSLAQCPPEFYVSFIHTWRVRH